MLRPSSRRQSVHASRLEQRLERCMEKQMPYRRPLPISALISSSRTTWIPMLLAHSLAKRQDRAPCWMPPEQRQEPLRNWHNTRSGLDIIDMMIDETPSFAHRDIKDIADAEDFLLAIDFPRQALVVSAVGAESILAKGVRDQSTLIDATRSAVSLSPTAQARSRQICGRS